MNQYPPGAGYPPPGQPGGPPGSVPPPQFGGPPGALGPRPSFPPPPGGVPGQAMPVRPPGPPFPGAGGPGGAPGMPPPPGAPFMGGPPGVRPPGPPMGPPGTAPLGAGPGPGMGMPPPPMPPGSGAFPRPPATFGGPGSGPPGGFPPPPMGMPPPGGPSAGQIRPPGPPFMPGPASTPGQPPLGPPPPGGIRPPGPGMPMQPPVPASPMTGPAMQGGGFAPPPPPPIDGARYSAGQAPPFHKPPGPGMPMQGGFMPPPPQPLGVPPGHMMGGGPQGPMGYDGGYNDQRLAEQFASLTMGGPNPGQENVDLNALPRPVGDHKDNAFDAPQPYDAYNCSPDNMRMTVNAMPNGTALRARWPLPFGALVHPMADERLGRTVPVVPLAGYGIIRCKRCRTYMNPFMTWTEGGRRFKCNVCATLNETPHEYYSAMGNDGRRMDFSERPELSTGTVEYVAPAEYMVRPPMPPVYVFVIDVSAPAVTSGALPLIAQGIKGVLDELPGDERTLIGFITFDSSIHFYNLKASLSQPQMLVVTELDDPFLPIPDELLVNLKESRKVVDALLDSLPNTFAANNTHTADSCMGPALQAAMMAMQHVGGKLHLFQAAVPNLGVGRIKNREQANVYGTDRESSLRQPEDAFYKRYASEASRNQITVDLYAFSMAYMDLASLTCLARYTCGDVYYYPGFTPQRDAVKLTTELQHNLRRPTAWEAVMRIRCSKGLRISAFHGHFFNRSTDLLALPTCDPDKSFAVEISHEESIVTGSIGYVQCALLYTNSNGERRIRVHTLACPVVTELSDMFKACDGPACATLLAKVSLEKSLTARLDETRAQMFQKTMQTFKEFRLIHSSSVRQPNRLIFPEALRYLPLWSLAATKCAALRGGAREVSPDERIAVGHELMAASVDGLCRHVYPDLYPLHQDGDWGRPRQDGSVPLPQTVPLSGAYLDESGAYLIDNGRVFVVWIGRYLNQQWGKEVFGIDTSSAEASDTSRLSVEPERPNAPLSSRVNAVLRELRRGRATYQQVVIVRQGSPGEMQVAQYFVEDRSPGMQSYPDWMIAIHKGVMAK